MCWKHAYPQHHPAHRRNLLQLMPASFLPSTSLLPPETSAPNSSPALSVYETQEFRIEDVDMVEANWAEHLWAQAIVFQRIRRQFWWSETHVPETWLFGASSQSCFGVGIPQEKIKYEKCSKNTCSSVDFRFKLKIQKLLEIACLNHVGPTEVLTAWMMILHEAERTRMCFRKVPVQHTTAC